MFGCVAIVRLVDSCCVFFDYGFHLSVLSPRSFERCAKRMSKADGPSRNLRTTPSDVQERGKPGQTNAIQCDAQWNARASRSDEQSVVNKVHGPRRGLRDTPSDVL